MLVYQRVKLSFNHTPDFYTMCSVRKKHSVLLSKSAMVDANCFIPGKKQIVVKGTCCLQVTICLDDISSSKK